MVMSAWRSDSRSQTILRPPQWHSLSPPLTAECGQTRICISHRDPYDAGMDTNCKALCSRDISHGLGCRRGTSGSRRHHFWGQTVAPRTPTHEANASSEAPGLRLQVKPAARDTQVGVEQAAFQHPLDQPPQDLPQRTLPNRACDQASATALGRDPAMSEAHRQKGSIKPGAKPLSS